nr:LysR family transcriptional regulator [Lactobacillus delbrueckii]
MLDFRVKTFLTVCETMNFTRAADRLHVTQPAVSQHIRYLEKEYQVKLFSYQGKKLTLTAAGEKLRQAMRQMQSDERLLKAEIKQADLPPVTMTIGEYALARPLSRFLKDHPQTNVEVVYGNTQFLTKKLDEGDLDFALIEGDPARGYASPRYQSEDFIAVCSPDLSFAKEPDQIADLFDQRLLVREPGFRDQEDPGGQLRRPGAGTERLQAVCPGRQHADDHPAAFGQLRGLFLVPACR